MESSDTPDGPTCEQSRESWRVREATSDDIDAIVGLRAGGAAAAFAGASHLPEIYATLILEFMDRQELERALGDPACHVFVATDREEHVVGTAQLTVDQSAGQLSACAAAIHGKGIGSALMRTRIETARRLGLSMVWLEIDTINPGGMAHAARHSFTPGATRPGRLIPENKVVRFELELPTEVT